MVPQKAKWWCRQIHESLCWTCSCFVLQVLILLNRGKLKWRSCSGDLMWVRNRIDEIIKEGIRNIRRILSCLKFLLQGYQSGIFLIKSQSCKCGQNRSLENWRSQRHSNECLESMAWRYITTWYYHAVFVFRKGSLFHQEDHLTSRIFWFDRLKIIELSKSLICILQWMITALCKNNCTEWISIYWKQHWL